MAGLEDMVRSSAPGGNIAKPLMIALGALLASGVLFRGGGAGQPAAAGSQPTSNEGAGGLLGGLGGLLEKFQQGGLGNVTNSWIGSGQNQPVSPGRVGAWPQYHQNACSAVRSVRGRADQTTVEGFAGGRRQADS
jgi:uncharacterized protein YidB (DUF937 family)